MNRKTDEIRCEAVLKSNESAHCAGEEDVGGDYCNGSDEDASGSMSADACDNTNADIPGNASRVRYPDNPPDSESARIREPEVAYGHRKQQGDYTLEDYYALPDDICAELIDGVIYDMSAPTFGHQSIATRLAVAFSTYIGDRHGNCEVVAGPVDVQLDRDDRTMVQPDVLILCDKTKLRNGVVNGAPDLVVEVLSPSTKKKDRTVKLRKYREAGVREYWIIDPERKEVEVYFFRNPELDTLPKVYQFDSVIPVGIYGGDCKVDFGKISRNLWDM